MRRQTESRQEAVAGAATCRGRHGAPRGGDRGPPAYPARLGRARRRGRACRGRSPRPQVCADAWQPASRLTRRRVAAIMRQKPRPGTGSSRGPEPHRKEPYMKRMTWLLAAIVLIAGAAALAATPKDTVVMAKQIDGIISLDPAESFEF